MDQFSSESADIVNNCSADIADSKIVRCTAAADNVVVDIVAVDTEAVDTEAVDIVAADSVAADSVAADMMVADPAADFVADQEQNFAVGCLCSHMDCYNRPFMYPLILLIKFSCAVNIILTYIIALFNKVFTV